MDWDSILGAKGGMAVSGILMIAMRVITTTPMGDATGKLVLACLAWLLAPLLAMLLLLAPPARAADMPVKAPANNWLNGYPYGGSGVYFGIYTEGGGGAVNATVPGVGSASLTTNSADVGGSVGYAWANKSGNVFVAIEAMFGWTNFNGSQQGFGLSGPASFEQRFLIGTPLANFFELPAEPQSRNRRSVPGAAQRPGRQQRPSLPDGGAS